MLHEEIYCTSQRFGHNLWTLPIHLNEKVSNKSERVHFFYPKEFTFVIFCDFSLEPVHGQLENHRKNYRCTVGL